MTYVEELEKQNEELKQSLAHAQSQSVYWDFEKTVYEQNGNTFHIVARYMITSKHVFAYISYIDTTYSYHAVLCRRAIAYDIRSAITYDIKTLEKSQEWIVDKYKELFLDCVDKQLT